MGVLITVLNYTRCMRADQNAAEHFGISLQAIGRIHQTLYQLVEMNATMQLFPAPFIHAVTTFECQKISLSDLAALRARIDSTYRALAHYARFLANGAVFDRVAKDTVTPAWQAELQFLQSALTSLATICRQWDARVAEGAPSLAVGVDFQLLNCLKQKKMSDMMASVFGSDSQTPGDPRVVRSMPSLAMVSVGDPDPAVLDGFVDSIIQSCLGGAVLLGRSLDSNPLLNR